ncbi:hypothetical protein GcM1_190024 [Golovinomyces cichoracearum]|uniref:Uncharacterized protein n=1 Tax=Golovinomyces cichoracearum TaxID=62708 RepID=A0A420J1Q4_9PEZI|nr:hypothetical protein GcM1_190024 [Golovinomyces cichoracearum]
MWVKAVWMNTTTNAAMWMDSTPHIRKITDNVTARRPSKISDLERYIFTDEFLRRFELVAPEDKDKSLRDCFSRVQGILKTIGVDGSSEFRGVAFSVKKFVIETIAGRFVLEIYNEELSARVIDRGAASSKSLHQAFEMHKVKDFDLIQESPAELNAVVNDFAQFNIDSVRAGNSRRPFAAAGVFSALPGRIIPTEAHSTQESHQQLSLPAPSPFQRHKDE